MITNLFSIFDPSTHYIILNNWTSMLFTLIILPSVAWLVKSRPTNLFKIIYNTIYTDLKPNSTNSPFILIIIISIFTIIITNNLIGLTPYIFTPSAHLSFTLALSLPIWFTTILIAWKNNANNLLVHLIPAGTPLILIPFIVLIETVRNLIRPITLSVRLAANMIAGHLLLILLSSAITNLTIFTALPLIVSQTALTILEIAVACIQAYVFRVLTTLYCAEITT